MTEREAVPQPVRAATLADARAIVELLRDVAAEDRWIRTRPPVDVDGRTVRLAERIETGLIVAFVAEIDGRIVGELTLFIDGARGAFGMLVAVEARGRGIGRALLDATIVDARRRGLTHIDLDVYTNNGAALALYRSAGFAPSGPAVPEDRGDGLRWEALPMALALI